MFQHMEPMIVPRTSYSIPLYLLLIQMLSSSLFLFRFGIWRCIYSIFLLHMGILRIGGPVFHLHCNTRSIFQVLPSLSSSWCPKLGWVPWLSAIRMPRPLEGILRSRYYLPPSSYCPVVELDISRPTENSFQFPISRIDYHMHVGFSCIKVFSCKVSVSAWDKVVWICAILHLYLC